MKALKGQTLVIVIMVMLIALAIGLSVSSRFIKGLKIVAQTDSASRAVAVAEASIERILLKPLATLQGYVNSGNCGADCALQITGSDGVLANSTIVLSSLGNSYSSYNLNLTATQTNEVTLTGYPNNTLLWVCWNNALTGDNPSVAGLYVYGAVGGYSVDNYAVNSVSSNHSDNGFSYAATGFGYQNCFSVTGKVSPVLLRLKSIYNSTAAVIFPTGGALIPSQGILITATGKVGSAVKKVQVLKTFPALPSQFDYTLFQKSVTNSLSN